VSNSFPSEVTLQENWTPDQAPLAGYAGCTRTECLIQPTSGCGKGVLNVSKNPADYEAFRGVAVDVLKTQNLTAIQSLKKFLTALPSPSYIRAVLLQSIYQLAEEDPEACRWVIYHRRALKPELDLVHVIQNIVLEHLQRWELMLNRDFSFTPDGQLQANDEIVALLVQELSVGARLLLEEILLMD
jgi:hypothetical protein